MTLETGMEKLDLRLVYPFMQATIDTLRVQCSFEVVPGKPRLKRHKVETKQEIVAIVGMMGKEIQGTIALCFPEKIFLAIMGQMFGETYSEITDELEDGASELLNIIFGQAKKFLTEKGHEAHRSIPCLVRGDDLTLNYVTTGDTVVLPLESKLGDFYLEVTSEKL